MRPVLVACVLGSLGACKTAPFRQESPAVILEPSPRSREELAGAVSTALNGVSVTLADDALTRETTLVLERAKHRDPSGLPAQGREMGMPERFRLVKDGADCVLVHERTGRRFTLRETTCAATVTGDGD